MTAKSKLNEARKLFHAAKIEKTGLNKFANYKYFELADFLVPALNIFDGLKLSAIVSFGAELAQMEITDLEDETSVVVIQSPMSTAELKACHAVQNLGAVQTYLRRYLWVTALEIVEHDAVDASDGPANTPKAAPKATKGKDPIIPAIHEVKAGVKNGDAAGAAAYLAGLQDAVRDAIWAGLTEAEQEQLAAQWPKE